MSKIKIIDLQLALKSEVETVLEEQLTNIQGGLEDVIIVYDDRVVIIPDDQKNVVVDRTTK